MKKPLKVRLLENRVNSAVNKIRERYPHLYYTVGGRYIRRILRGLFTSPEEVSTEFSLT